PLGGKQTDRNPYIQLRTQRAKITKWLQNHPAVSNAVRADSSRYIDGWVIISPGFDGNLSRLQLPWNEIGPWLKVLPIQDLAGAFYSRRPPSKELADSEVRALVDSIGVPPYTDISSVFPKIPPAPRLFSHPDVSTKLVDREAECATLRDYLLNKEATVICLGGKGGVGKTTLAAWLVKQVENNHEVYWINCADHKSMTANTLLSAISPMMPLELQVILRQPGRDRRMEKAASEFDQDENDRFDIALSTLSKHPCVIVFDDYHAITDRTGIARFIKRAFLYKGNLHIVLTTRVNPHQADWLPSAYYREIAVEKLPADVFADYIRQNTQIGTLRSDQIQTVYKKVSGNPEVIKTYQKVIEHHRLLDTLDQLPVFSEQESDPWINSLLDTLSQKAREYAEILAVAGEGERLTPLLLCRLYHGPATDALTLADELVDNYVMDKLRPDDVYVLHDLTCNYLYTRTTPDRRQIIHSLVGQQYTALAGETTDLWLRADLQVKAIQHFQTAGLYDKIPDTAVSAHGVLTRSGDWDQTIKLSKQALEAAQKIGQLEVECYWALQLAEDLLFIGEDHDQIRTCLRQAEQCLPQPSAELSDAGIREWREREIRLWILTGRIQYRSQNFDEASESSRKAAILARLSNNDNIEARCFIQLGLIERRQERPIRAQEFFKAALAIAQKQMDSDLEFECLRNLGVIVRKRGKIDEAHMYGDLARQKADDLGPLAKEMSLSNLGRLEDQLGHFTAAEPLLRDALCIARQTHNIRGTRIELTRLINVLIPLYGHTEEVTNLLQESEQLNKKAEDSIGMAWNKKHQGQIEQLRGNPAHGDKLIREGIDILKAKKIREHIEEFEATLSSS
ncbi:MAG: tetratricopeptide repeat protein, partial [Chloroflexi bacterium]|nr:tetratricopeptide repeat protein [Chloroflexota bacterium]